MRDYEECLYQYIMENKFQEIYHDREYVALRGIRKDAEQALSDPLTREQRKLFHTYAEQENAVGSVELRHIFREALLLGLRLSRR